MKQVQSILVGVDFLPNADSPSGLKLTNESHLALLHACSLAQNPNCKLTLCSVSPNPGWLASIGTGDRAAQLLETQAEKRGEALKQLADELATRDVSAQTTLRRGESWTQMIQEANQGTYDLVVVGSKPKSSDWNPFPLGSTATRLARQCQKLLWVVRSSMEQQPPTILVADSLSGEKCALLDEAVEIAQLLESRLLVAHVVEPQLESHLIRHGLSEPDIQAMRSEAIEAAESKLNEKLSKSDARTLDQGVQVVAKHGHPESILSELAEEHQCELMIIGKHHRTGLGLMLLGHTVEQIIPSVSCSLLILPLAETSEN